MQDASPLFNKPPLHPTIELRRIKIFQICFWKLSTLSKFLEWRKSCLCHYDALRTKIDMWLAPYSLWKYLKRLKNEVTQLIKNKCKYKFINHDGKHFIKKSVHSNADLLTSNFPKQCRIHSYFEASIPVSDFKLRPPNSQKCKKLTLNVPIIPDKVKKLS